MNLVTLNRILKAIAAGGVAVAGMVAAGQIPAKFIPLASIFSAVGTFAGWLAKTPSQAIAAAVPPPKPPGPSAP